jgi:putative PIN family toxin of toxin-antitoxin system
MVGPRVVIDTNVLVSGLAYPSGIPGRILNVWQHGGVRVVLSRYILDETVRILPRLTKLQLSSDRIRTLIGSLTFLADIVEPDAVHEPPLRDPADQAVLGTLLASGADYLITGDKDLLALAGTYPIVTPTAFWARCG